MKRIIGLVLCLFVHLQLEPSSKKALQRKYHTIATQVDAIIDNHPHMHIGCEIYSLKHDQRVYCHNEKKLFTPASNTKIFTALLALETLGADYRFETVLATDGSRDGSSIKGNIYIKSSGDPSLTSKDVGNLIKILQEKGITAITGNLCIDHDEFDQEGFALGSFLDNIGASWNSPINSFMIDRKPFGLNPVNTVTFANNAPLKDMYFDGASFLQTLLRKYGIELQGKVVFGTCPKNYSRMNSHFSEKNSVLLSRMLQVSDNIYADCLFKKIGANRYGCPGTWAKGIDAQISFLEITQCIEGDLVIKDGSGISRYNLISPHHIVSLLQWAYDQPYFDSFRNSLAMCGCEGSLKDRLLDLKLQLKAKTGTLLGISALSGYLETEDDLFAFSILVNGFVSKSLYNPPCKTDVENAICKILAAA
jgi:D-alanyl-D-alanine carboxypeptidase/D-alanyl-D-alanine-endopeptidase (penicillin-binding protein 4)